MDVGGRHAVSNNEHRVRFDCFSRQNSVRLKADLNAKLYISKQRVIAYYAVSLFRPKSPFGVGP